jgi:hypothetical protein
MMAEIVWLSLELPQGLSNLAAHARQEWRAACEEYRAQCARMSRQDKWHDWQELERLDALKERRKLAWDRWWKQRVGR